MLRLTRKLPENYAKVIFLSLHYIRTNTVALSPGSKIYNRGGPGNEAISNIPNCCKLFSVKQLNYTSIYILGPSCTCENLKFGSR